MFKVDNTNISIVLVFELIQQTGSDKQGSKVLKIAFNLKNLKVTDQCAYMYIRRQFYNIFAQSRLNYQSRLDYSSHVVKKKAFTLCIGDLSNRQNMLTVSVKCCWESLARPCSLISPDPHAEEQGFICPYDKSLATRQGDA